MGAERAPAPRLARPVLGPFRRPFAADGSCPAFFALRARAGRRRRSSGARPPGRRTPWSPPSPRRRGGRPPSRITPRARSRSACWPPSAERPERPAATTRRRRPTAAATARLFLRSCARLRNVGRFLRLHRGVVHGLRVVLDDEDLPLVSVRISDPDLVLKGVAARRVLFGPRVEPCLLEPRPRCRDVLAGGDLDAEVTGVDAGSGSLDHREVERGS